MSAQAFLMTRKGGDWSLAKAATPISVRKAFKDLVVNRNHDYEEVIYFDTRGSIRKKRFKSRVSLEQVVVEDEPAEAVKSKGRPSNTTKKRK